MQKTLLSIIVVFFFTISYGQKSVKIELQTNENRFEIKSLSEIGFTVENSISTLHLNPISSPEGNFMSLESKGLI